MNTNARTYYYNDVPTYKEKEEEKKPLKFPRYNIQIIYPENTHVGGLFTWFLYDLNDSTIPLTPLAHGSAHLTKITSLIKKIQNLNESPHIPPRLIFEKLQILYSDDELDLFISPKITVTDYIFMK